jgi:hypothetical protein
MFRSPRILIGLLILAVSLIKPSPELLSIALVMLGFTTVQQSAKQDKSVVSSASDVQPDSAEGHLV